MRCALRYALVLAELAAACATSFPFRLAAGSPDDGFEAAGDRFGSPDDPFEATPVDASGSGEESVSSRKDTRWYAIPNAAFDTDDGLGFGARAELALDAPGYAPYKSAYVLHIFASTRGYHHHRFRFDRTRLGPEGRFRLTGHFAYRQWLNDGYWGLGNDTARERAFAGPFGPDDPARKRYRYKLFQPFLHVTLRTEIAGPWKAFGALALKWSEVRFYTGSLLEEERPFGTDGGPAAQVFAGILFDTRQPEVTPNGGVLAEISGRVAPKLPGGDGAFGGVFGSIRGYASLSSRFVIAARLMSEILFGSIPFYELVHWGGSVPITGFGGFETLRGIAFGRWRGPGKVVLNTEFRLDVLRHDLGDRPFRWLLVPYVDAGFVFGAREDGAAKVGTPPSRLPIHPATGLGIRAVYDDAFVGRIDVGVGIDPIREADGSLTRESTVGVYIVFDHTF